MKTAIPDFSNARVLIIGDLMLDRYWHGDTRRISPEAPVPVVKVNGDELRAGGASNVALNITALGAQATLLGITGDDQNARLLQNLLEAQQVQCHFHKDDARETIVKLRIIAQHQQMIRLDFEDSFAPLPKQPMIEQYLAALNDCDVIILSDYNKGTLSDPQPLIQAGNANNTPVIVDPKGDDFAKYRGATLLTPNRHEFETVVGSCADEETLIQKGQALLDQLEMEALLITRGGEGMSLIRRDAKPFHLPTYAREVFDVTGAGDTVIGTLAAALAAKAPLEEAVALANHAAGQVVRKLGTATTNVAEIQLAMHQHDQSDDGLVDEAQLQQLIQLAQEKGETVVMTNGCFDILHVGHISYLQKARALGDHLVVAVNSDASVRQLKGKQRPVNALQNRMKMLAALECVDWVVSFTEETPTDLYCKVLPDVIVKGGDYTPEEVAGGDCVTANGGHVEIIDFVDGQSTSAIIDKIRASAGKS